MRLPFAPLVFLLTVTSSSNALAACTLNDLKFLQSAGYSVSDAVLWCKSSAQINGDDAVQSSPSQGSAKAEKNESASNATKTFTGNSAESKEVKSQNVPKVKNNVPAKDVNTGDQGNAALAENSAGSSAAGMKSGAGSTDSSTSGNSSSNVATFVKGWGVGLAYIYNRSPIVSDATIVNGVVRANTVQHYQTSLIVGSHWYFQSDPAPKPLPSVSSSSNGCGPGIVSDHGLGCLGVFLGVGIGGGNSTSQLIDFVGGGLIWGFGSVLGSDGRPDPQTKKHSIGIGVGRRFNVKMLGAGFVPNQAPPPGETQIRYETRDTYAPFLFYTYNF